MPDKPVARTRHLATTGTLATTECDAERRTRAEAGPGTVPADGGSNARLPTAGDDPDVGLSQKGIGEDAVIRRETEI